MKAEWNLTLTASLLISAVHAIPVAITHIVGVYAAVVWTLELSWMARASTLCHRMQDNSWTLICLLNLCTFEASYSDFCVIAYRWTLWGTLTTVGFIWTVPTVIVCVTAPGMRDAVLVGTSELIRGTRPRYPCRTVVFVAVIKAVVVPIAAPCCRHTAFVGTSECRRGASAICKEENSVKVSLFFVWPLDYVSPSMRNQWITIVTQQLKDLFWMNHSLLYFNRRNESAILTGSMGVSGYCQLRLVLVVANAWLCLDRTLVINLLLNPYC